MGTNFWIFLVTWLPLTFLTIAIYLSFVPATRKYVKVRFANNAQTEKEKGGMCEPLASQGVRAALRNSLTRLRERRTTISNISSTHGGLSV